MRNSTLKCLCSVVFYTRFSSSCDCELLLVAQFDMLQLKATIGNERKKVESLEINANRQGTRTEEEAKNPLGTVFIA